MLLLVHITNSTFSEAKTKQKQKKCNNSNRAIVTIERNAKNTLKESDRFSLCEFFSLLVPFHFCYASIFQLILCAYILKWLDFIINVRNDSFINKSSCRLSLTSTHTRKKNIFQMTHSAVLNFAKKKRAHITKGCLTDTTANTLFY